MFMLVLDVRMNCMHYCEDGKWRSKFAVRSLHKNCIRNKTIPVS